MSIELQMMLSGRGPLVQGAALADLVSLFFAGHNPAIREEVIGNWINAMRKLIPASERQIAGMHGGLPEEWTKQ